MKGGLADGAPQFEEKGYLLDLSGTREKSDSHPQGPELNRKTRGSRWECWATKDG